MAYRPAIPMVFIGRDRVVPLAEGPARFIGFTPGAYGEPRGIIEFANGDQSIMSMAELISAMELDTPELFDSPPPLSDSVTYDGLPDYKKRQIDQRERDLTLMMTGDADGDILMGKARGPEHVDPRYDPETLTKEARYERMSADIDARGQRELGGHSPSTLRRQAAAVRNGGRDVLIHGRWGQRGKLTAPAEIEDLVDDYLAADEDASTKDIQAHLALLVMHVRNAGLEGRVSENRLRDIFISKAQGMGILLNAQTKRSKAGRPKQNRAGVWGPTVPYQFLEIDSTPIDLLLLDQYQRIVSVTHLLVAVCALTRKVAGLRLVTSAHPYDSREIRGLIWECIRGAVGRAPGRVTWGSSDVALPPVRALRLPAAVHLNPPVLPGRFGTANVDRGSQFNNHKTLNSLRAIGCHVRLNDPGAGFQKPHVEAFFKTMGALLQKMPAYTGPNPAKRGRNLERGPLLAAADLLELLHVWLDVCYHSRPHTQLKHPDFPSRRFSPNEFMMLNLSAGGQMTIDIDLERALQLLYPRRAALRDKGVEVNRRFYNSQELDDLKAGNLGDRNRAGLRIQVWPDERHPEFVYARHPHSREVFIANDIHAIGPPRPLADLLDREMQEAIIFGQDLPAMAGDASAAEQRLVEISHERAVAARASRSPGLKPIEPASDSTTSPPNLRVVDAVAQGAEDGAAEQDLTAMFAKRLKEHQS